MDRLPKWYKKRIMDKHSSDFYWRVIEKRIVEAVANPRPKKPKISPQDNNTNNWSNLFGGSPKPQSKTKIIFSAIVLIIITIFAVLGIMDKVEQYKNKNKANSNKSTQQTQLAKQPTTNMIRCDDRELLKKVIQSHKNSDMNDTNANPQEFDNVRQVYRKYDINLTSTKQFIDSLKYNIKNVRTKSSDKANRRIECEAEMETVAPVPPSNPIKIYATIGYNARLMDNGEIILDTRMINK